MPQYFADNQEKRGINKNKLYKAGYSQFSVCKSPRKFNDTVAINSLNFNTINTIFNTFINMNQQLGKYIIIFGAVIIGVGLLVYFFHNKLHWFGRLPGDVRIERENFKFYFPITTMILLSILLTILINFLRKL